MKTHLVIENDFLSVLGQYVKYQHRVHKVPGQELPNEFEVVFVKHYLSNTLHHQLLGAVHILRQPPEGGEGVSQMLTIADEGGLSQR